MARIVLSWSSHDSSGPELDEEKLLEKILSELHLINLLGWARLWASDYKCFLLHYWESMICQLLSSEPNLCSGFDKLQKSIHFCQNKYSPPSKYHCSSTAEKKTCPSWCRAIQICCGTLRQALHWLLAAGLQHRAWSSYCRAQSQCWVTGPAFQASWVK